MTFSFLKGVEVFVFLRDVLICCVSGGGSGIGRAVCQRFASEGASVAVADRNEESANQTLELLSHDLKGQEHLALGVDVSSKDSVEKLVTSIQVWGTCY